MGAMIFRALLPLAQEPVAPTAHDGVVELEFNAKDPLIESYGPAACARAMRSVAVRTVLAGECPAHSVGSAEEREG